MEFHVLDFYNERRMTHFDFKTERTDTVREDIHTFVSLFFMMLTQCDLREVQTEA